MKTTLLFSAAFIFSFTSIAAAGGPRPLSRKSIKQRFQKRYGHVASLRRTQTVKGLVMTLNRQYRANLKASDINFRLRKKAPYLTDHQFREGNNFNNIKRNTPYPAQSLIHAFGFSLKKSGVTKVGQKLSGHGKVFSPKLASSYRSHVEIKGDITVVTHSYDKNGKKTRHKQFVKPIETYLGYDFL